MTNSFRWRTWPLKAKLLFLTLFTSTLGIVLVSASLIAVEKQRYQKEMQSELGVLAKILAEQSTAALLFSDDEQLTSIISSMSHIKMIRQVCVYGDDSTLRSSLKPISVNQCPDIKGAISIGFVGDSFYLLEPVMQDGDVIGYFYLSSHLQVLRDHLYTFIIIAFSIAAATLTALVFIALWLQRVVSRPIRSLSWAAHRISRNQDYSIRVPVRDYDEIGRLGTAFNEMISTIQEQNHRILKSRDELEHMVEERTAELRLANQELEAFSHSISHDLRAPLRAIEGFGQAMEEDCGADLDAIGHGYLNRIRAASQRMGRLIDGLQVLTQVSRNPLQMDSVDISEMLEGMARDLHDIHPGSQTWINVDPGIQTVGDSRILRVAFQNLLENAWKYSSKEEQPRIQVSSRREGDALTVSIQDNGVGFDMRHYDKLFEAFNRLHGPADFEGSGLGLATVYRAIHRHQGRIDAESTVGEGARFTVTLPASQPS